MYMCIYIYYSKAPSRRPANPPVLNHGPRRAHRLPLMNPLIGTSNNGTTMGYNGYEWILYEWIEFSIFSRMFSKCIKQLSWIHTDTRCLVKTWKTWTNIAVCGETFTTVTVATCWISKPCGARPTGATNCYDLPLTFQRGFFSNATRNMLVSLLKQLKWIYCICATVKIPW